MRLGLGVGNRLILNAKAGFRSESVDFFSTRIVTKFTTPVSIGCRMWHEARFLNMGPWISLLLRM